MRATLLPPLLVTLLTLGACAVPAPTSRVYAVFFTNESAALDEAAQSVVASAAASAKQQPGKMVNVAGYANRLGTPAATAQLSKARADAVAALMVADGVPDARITRTPVGVPPDSQPGIESRRVEIDIGDP